MKKNDFDNRLQNDLFPEMPISFGRKLTKAMEDEGVKVKKRPTATGVFTGAVSVAAAAVSVPATLAGKLKAPQSLPSATLLLGRYQHVIYPTVLLTKEANGKEIAVLMFAGGLDEETTASIRSYVFTGLYEQTMMAINGLPKDSENYHELEEQNKLVKSMESSVQPEKPKNAEP